ncbi:hypothetical protein U9K47_10335 [Bacillus toyonensis]|uniref:hypothetical protein n=1 Tax=Bacillus toyonensis TaxID=155322 RepID=UPI003466D94A
MNKNKMDELEKLSRPLVEFLQKNYHPHCQIIIGSETIRIVEDMMSLPVPKLEK